MNVQNIEERWKICEECPIYNSSSKVCNSNLWINPDTNEVSTHSKVGYIQGCGCLLSSKIRNLSNHCIIGRW